MSGNVPPDPAGTIPAQDVDVTDALVHALLADQHTDLAGRRLARAANGWDNIVYRLGDDLAVRLPRRASAHQLLLNELRWLPFLAPRLPLPIPAAIRRGRPGSGYPYHWAVVPWFEGESAARRSARDRDGYAASLGRFLRLLHVPAPADAPHNRVRGIALATRGEAFAERLHATAPPLEGPWREIFEAGARARLHRGPRVWLHGDPHPHNLVVAPGAGPAQLVAVADFGDLTAGDPASDLAAAWLHFTAAGRQVFRAELRYDDDTWLRARGWAVHYGLLMASMPPEDPLHPVGIHALGELAAEA
ncbi:aminoglycoside phosphotransferase family protein [Arthrobacter sp. JSM 101049]|uniref:aminoglycoside phosphotransferase family protein n=1 Tax=Arthrobacter sp. JSM 101049 TaxID=929097 RepID=UPI003566AC3D